LPRRLRRGRGTPLERAADAPPYANKLN